MSPSPKRKRLSANVYKRKQITACIRRYKGIVVRRRYGGGPSGADGPERLAYKVWCDEWLNYLRTERSKLYERPNERTLRRRIANNHQSRRTDAATASAVGRHHVADDVDLPRLPTPVL